MKSAVAVVVALALLGSSQAALFTLNKEKQQYMWESFKVRSGTERGPVLCRVLLPSFCFGPLASFCPPPKDGKGGGWVVTTVPQTTASSQKEYGKSYETPAEEQQHFETFIANLAVADERNVREQRAGGSAVHGAAEEPRTPLP